MFNRLLLLLFTLTVGFVQAEVPLINLEQLDSVAPDYNGQLIKIKGFLYEDSQGRIILASQPHLKSCCVGSQAKIKQQLIIEGSMPSTLPQHVSLLEGMFLVSPQYDRGDALTQLYVLQDAHVLMQTNNSLSVWLAAGSGVVLSLLWAIVRRIRRANGRSSSAL